jgi:hypothetical protein
MTVRSPVITCPSCGHVFRCDAAEHSASCAAQQDMTDITERLHHISEQIRDVHQKLIGRAVVRRGGTTHDR